MTGDDALECNTCRDWFHRRCVCVSLNQFSKLSTSDEPFLCASCVQHDLRDSVSSLQALVGALQLEICNLKSNHAGEVEALKLELAQLKDSSSTASSSTFPFIAGVLAMLLLLRDLRLHLLVFNLLLPWHLLLITTGNLT